MNDVSSQAGRAARRLVRSSRRAALATALAGDGWPYASLVMVACAQDASPLLMISALAEHTRNLGADPRASLLYDGTIGLDNPLTGLRATLLGPVAPCDDRAALARYVRRHPDAERYLSLGDFRLYRMAVERAHVVAGFGAIDWLSADRIVFEFPKYREFAEAEEEIVRHMNEDHGDAVTLYAVNLLGLEGDGWRMTGIDPEGVDLACEGAVARVDFEHPVADAGAARKALVDLVAKARATGKPAN